MIVNWVISQTAPPGIVKPNIIKSIAPSWGSWQTRESYKTDNCVCNDSATVVTLIKRAFHAVCNFYIPSDIFKDIGSPPGIKLFDGQFKGAAIANKDDIIALNIAVPATDIVLLLGFNLGPISPDDPIRTEFEAYHFNVSAVIESNPDVQFVLVDYNGGLSSTFKQHENLTEDTLQSVMELLL